MVIALNCRNRDHFAMKDNTLPELKESCDMARFFFWTTWMASTQRPGTDTTYTNNWPHEPLLDHNQHRSYSLDLL